MTTRGFSKGKMSPQRLAVDALFVALTAVCAQITIPIGAVPVSLSLLPVLLCAALLSPADAIWSMVAYMLLGLAGVPIFSGFQGGPGKLFGVTGGYIIGYIPCVFLIGMMLKKWGRSFVKLCVSMAAGVLVCYLFGTIWFMVLRHTDLMTTLGLCVIPFLPFDAGKILIAAWLSQRLLPILRRVVPGLMP